MSHWRMGSLKLGSAITDNASLRTDGRAMTEGQGEVEGKKEMKERDGAINYSQSNPNMSPRYGVWVNSSNRVEKKKKTSHIIKLHFGNQIEIK